MWQDHQLDNVVSKATEALTLWRTEKGLVEISKDTLATAIKANGKQKGYVFHGLGRLLLDTIVETEDGAIGKSVEREIKEPFLMLGNTEEIQQRLSAANAEDLTRVNYENQNRFISNAEDLLNQFFRREKMNCCGRSSEFAGSLFAFRNEAKKLDVLVPKDDGFVYTARDMVFVSNKDKAVLKSPLQIVLSRHGRSFFING
jgi:hypothetical protein